MFVVLRSKLFVLLFRGIARGARKRALVPSEDENFAVR